MLSATEDCAQALKPNGVCLAEFLNYLALVAPFFMPFSEFLNRNFCDCYSMPVLPSFVGEERNYVSGITPRSSRTPDLDDLNEIWDF